MNQSGIYNTQQLKELSVLINACIPANDASQAQILKSFMIMYLPWLPINESTGFNFGGVAEESGEKSSAEDTITIYITTKNYGIVKIFLYKENDGYDMDVNCRNDFPKEKFHEAIKSDSSFVLKNPPTYTTRTKADEENDKNETNITFSKSLKVTPQLLVIIHAIIKLVMEIDSQGTLQDKRKENL